MVADGTSAVRIDVSGSTGGGAITASTSRGLFTNGQRAIQAASTPTTLTLVTCHDALDPGCAGSVLIRAVDASGVAGVATVTFTSSGGGGAVTCTSCGASACVGMVCDSSGHTCSANTPSTCSTCPTGDVEICGDGVDNDCNGLVDCADPQCQPVGNALGGVCDLVGHTCSVNGAPGPSACTTCSGNGGTAETTEASCGDGKDNDCNGLVDCQDAACAGQPCALGFTCDATRKTCTVPSTTCTACGQPQCVGMTCDAQGRVRSSGSPSTCSTCPVGVTTCADPALFALTLVPASERIAANGSSTTTVTATLTFDGAPVPGKTIAFTTSAGTFASTPSPTNASGQTTIVLQSAAAGDVATVTGTFAARPGSTVSGTATISMPLLGRITHLASDFEVLGARHSGFQEQSVLTYQVFDAMNLPYPPGLTVNFEHESLVGSFIGTGLAPNCSGTPVVCRATGVTDANGRASVSVSSGTAAGEILINADARAGNQPKSAVAHKLAIVGAKANGAQVTMACYLGDATNSPQHASANRRNVPAFSNSDCNFPRYVDGNGLVVTCKALLADRFNNVIGRETRVQFFSEGGTAGPSTLTPPYDTTVAPASQKDLGLGLGYVRPDGKLPVDVLPFGGELRASYPDGCDDTAVHNPRDGLLTIIAIVNGEEGFVDLNGNGVYDSGEPFVDMGEPYIDANDNGTWEVGEYFVDVNGNGIWDPPDGQWNANTVNWVETQVLFSGLPLHRATGGTSGFEAGGFYDPVTFAPIPSFNVAPGTPQTVTFAIGDGNFNPQPGGASFVASMTGANATAALTVDPTSTDTLGMAFTQQYCTVKTLEEVTGPAVCSNVCPSGGTNNACYVVTNVGNCTPGTSPRSGCTGFGFGSIGQATVTAGAPAGANTLQVTGTGTSGATGTLPGTVTP